MIARETLYQLFDEAVRYSYGKLNGAMSPDLFVEYLLLHQGDFGYEVAREELLEVVNTPSIYLFDDVAPLFENLRATAQIVPVIWTQGEHSHHLVDGIGHQQTKIQRSGLLEMMPDDWTQRLERVGLAGIIGDYDKKSPEELDKIVAAIKEKGIRHLVLVDDKIENLTTVQEHFNGLDIEISAFWLNRQEKEEDVPPGIHVITTLGELDFRDYPESLILIDFDNTLNDTIHTKADTYDRLGAIFSPFQNV